MQVFIMSLQQPHKPWASLVEQTAAEQHSAQARRPPQPMHQPACDSLPQISMQHLRHSVASNANLPDSFGLDRPATAKELMSGPQQPPQQELPSLGSCQLYPAHSGQRAASLPRALPSALGVFADCSDSDEDDTELLQAAMEADQRLQPRVGDRGQKDLPVDVDGISLNTSQPGGIFDGQEMGHLAPHWAAGPHFHGIQTEAHADLDHMQRSIPGIVYECSNEDADCQAPEQLRGMREIEVSQGTPSVQACSRPGQAAQRGLDDEISLSDVSAARAERPAPEDAPGDFVFCDAQDTAWYDQPISLQGQKGGARSEPSQPSATCPPHSDAQLASLADCREEDRCGIRADRAGWHSNAQRSSTRQASPLAAAKKKVELLKAVSNPSSCIALAVRARVPDPELEDIRMVIDGTEEEDMQQYLSSLTAATASKARDAMAPAGRQGLHAGALAAAAPAQGQADEHVIQSEWALEAEDSEGIVFDDTAVDFTVQWMHGDNEIQAAMHAEDLVTLGQQPVHSNAAEAHARQKRAREELRDKLIQVGVRSANCNAGASMEPIMHEKVLRPVAAGHRTTLRWPEGVLEVQELVEDSGRSTRLEPLIAHMREQLAAMTPDASGLYPTSLQKLRQGCVNTKVPGAEASLQRHMFALLTLVQRSNTGPAGACGAPMAGRTRLKLESVHSSHDVHIHRVLYD